MNFPRPDRRPGLEAEAAAVLAEALEALRWCRAHLGERGVGEALRGVETRLGYLAQALGWQMDGEAEKADVALGVARGLSRRRQLALRQAQEEVLWEH